MPLVDNVGKQLKKKSNYTMKQQKITSKNQPGVLLGEMAKKMPVVDTDGRFKTKNKKHSAKIIKKSNMVFITFSKLFIECG